MVSVHGADSGKKRRLGTVAARTEIRTERLLLRPFQGGDVADALAYRNDLEFARFLHHIPQPFTSADAISFVAVNMSEPWERSPTFAVTLSRTVIGTVNLEVEATSQSAMLGYAIGRSWWGQGLATEAAQAVLAWAIESFDLTRIWASTDSRHVRSIRVLEKLALVREDLRIGDHFGRNGELVDEVVYARNLRDIRADSIG